MAATRGLVWGYDKSRTKERSTLGSVSCEATVATWNTFIESYIRADGTGHVRIKRNGVVIHQYNITEKE